MKNATILTGIRRFTSKKGVDFAVLQLLTPFNEREVARGCSGNKVEEQFVPENLFTATENLVVGKPIHLEYEVSGGRAFVIGFSTVEK